MEEQNNEMSDLDLLLQTGSDDEIRAFVRLLQRDDLLLLLPQCASETRERVMSYLHPSVIAELLTALDSQAWKPLIEPLDAEQLSAVLTELEDPEIERVLQHIEPETLPDLLSEMDSDDAADILGEMAQSEVQAILRRMDHEDAASIQELLKYDEESAGGIMQTELVCVQLDSTVGEAIPRIREQVEAYGGDMDLYEVFVVDDKRQLQGRFSLEKLVLSAPSTPIEELLSRDIQWVTPKMDQEEVAALFERYDLISLPVVDEEKKLIGRITIDDIVDVIKEEASEDILQMAGVGGSEDLVADRTMRSAMLRLPWLVTNLFGGLLTGYFMWFFKATLDQLLALITFVPVITGMGGNVGTQSASVTIRGFALGRIDLKNIWRFFYKEMRVGALMGLICGISLTLVGWFWHGNASLGLLVGGSLFVAMTFASSMGTLIPALFERFEIDPALASGPFVTTLNDVSGILIYLSTASFFIHYLR